ncbi:MAG: hypothetical protein AB7L13_12575 [Acidimicrobiia bacterium]
MTKHQRFVVAIVGFIAAGISFGTAYRNAYNLPPSKPSTYGVPYAGIYAIPENGWQDRLNQSDGQAFAQLATDPTLSRPLVFVDGRNEAAYRAQRPVFGYLTWLASLGQRAWVPVVIFALTSLTVAALAMTSAVWLARRAVNPWFGLYVVILPGVQSIIVGGGPDAMAGWLVLAAVMAYERRVPQHGASSTATTDRRDLWIVSGLFAVAALTRETTMIVAFVVALVHWWRSGLGIASAFRSGAALIAGVPLAVYFAWLAVVRVRFGAWPWNSNGRLDVISGLLAWRSVWRDSDWVICIVGFALVALCLMVARKQIAAWVVAAFGAFSLVLGEFVWHKWEDFSRVLLPMWLFAMLLALVALVEYGRAQDARRAELRAAVPAQ